MSVSKAVFIQVDGLGKSIIVSGLNEYSGGEKVLTTWHYAGIATGSFAAAKVFS